MRFAKLTSALLVVFAISFGASLNVLGAEQAQEAASSSLIPKKITLDKQEYSRYEIIKSFIDIAFSTHINLQNNSSISRQSLLSLYSGRGNLWADFLAPENLKLQYPWLYEYVYRDQGIPRYVALNRWAQPVRISTGYPFDLKPAVVPSTFVGKNPDDYKPLKGAEDVVSPEAEKTVVDEVIRDIPALKEGSGLDISYLPHSQETRENFGNVRIVLLDKSTDVWLDKFKENGRAVWVVFPRGVEVSFRSQVEDSLLTAVNFTPFSQKQVDGYFLSNANNEIGLSFCFIWQGHEPSMLKALVRECLLRSMGLPESPTTRVYHAVLSLWNDENAWIPVYKPLLPKAPEITDFDRFMLKILYSPDLKPGSPYLTVFNQLNK